MTSSSEQQHNGQLLRHRGWLPKAEQLYSASPGKGEDTEREFQNSLGYSDIVSKTETKTKGARSDDASL